MVLVFDAVNTLIFKPQIYLRIQDVLMKNNFFLELEDIKFKHKLLSEVILFPDRTSKDFYDFFNSELLNLLAVPKSQNLLNQIFEECSYLPWERFEDTDFLNTINNKKFIISNFNNSLSDLIQQQFSTFFDGIFVSEEVKLRKPSKEFYTFSFDKIAKLCGNQEIIYIGDSFKLDYEPVENLGYKSILIDRDNMYRSNIRKINSFYELDKYVN